MKHIKRYKFFITRIVVMIILTLHNVNLGVIAIQTVGFSMKEMILWSYIARLNQFNNLIGVIG